MTALELSEVREAFVDVVKRVIDELATETVARASEERAASRAPSRPGPRFSEPDGIRQVLELLEILPTEHRTAAAFRDDLLATLKRWRVRARDGKPHYWTNRGD